MVQQLNINTCFLVTNVPNIQDIQFCSLEDSACYTAVSQQTSDCDISCTGLYADVVFNEDKVLSLKTDLGKTIMCLSLFT